MNDLEDTLRSLAFREPPCDLRRRILAAAPATPRWSWRDWLWPSPLAWGALAAVWLVAFATSPAVDFTKASRTPLIAFAAHYDIEQLLSSQ